MSVTQQRASVSLGNLLPAARLTRGAIMVQSVCTSADRCQPGDLFVGVVTSEGDSHDDAAIAVAKGAVGVLTERLLPLNVPQCIVEDTREELGRVCQALAGNPCDELRTIAVVGTRGKTVTSLLIASMLEAAGEAVGVLSSIGLSDSLEQVITPSATPRAPKLAHWLERMTLAGCQSAVVELSGRALAERRAAGMEFDAVVLTNLKRSEQSWHGSEENFRRANLRSLEMLKPGGFAVFNADDVESEQALSNVDLPVLTFGMISDAQVTATVIERCPSEQTFLLQAGCESIPVRTAIIGDQHVQNCLAATATGLALGMNLATIVRGLEAVKFIPGRLQRIECGQNFNVFVDSARSPEGLAASLRSLRQAGTGRIICVMGCQGGKDKETRPRIGHVLDRCTQLSIITSDNPRHEQPLSIAHDILDGHERPHLTHTIPNRAKAIRFALESARPGDTVLIAGKGDRQGQRIGSGKQSHDDCEVARKWLYEQATPVQTRPQLRIFG
ncbi:MurE-like ligase [Anatilimnocola aggregata]|uniref:MurE-like ligase n=1 Tax=Anatilimnocola aggregata TaxID=2528021 RepID=A0A517YHC3_9BACT|nr:UDP-N-acetylmuramoyl-L-alanyl-D-glutamate--2,6-diaminopimelate ligase [Anatilimnocola aggregata]QDU29612.1 MurE-like ligase [Anatilimnocola aggregata]